MIGRTYLMRGEAVTVLARWRDAPGSRGAIAPAATFVCDACGRINPPATPDLACAECGGCRRRRGGAPRNVLLRLPDGSLTVRPFRGLRRPDATSEEDR